MVNHIPNDENIVNTSVTVIVNDELSKFISKEEVIGFFKDTLNFEGLSVSIVTEE